MSSTSGGWAQLRQQVRSLEAQTETLFHTYSQYAALTNLPAKQTEEEKQTESNILNILEKRDTLITQLSRLLDSEAALTASALKRSNLNRHREILLEHRKELITLKSQIKDARNRANLLTSVRSDIDAYQSNDPETAESTYMLGERSRIENSLNTTDNVLNQAYAVNESFGSQRETLARINRQITGAAAQLPGLNNIIGKISAKKRRDGTIMASFIAICFLMFMYFS